MPSTSCPPPNILADFAMGRLDMAGIDDVSRHLETCSECSEKLGTLQVRDSLLDAVRTPASGDAQSDPALSELISRLQSYAQTVDSEMENIPLSDRLACLRPAESPDELGRLGRYRVLQVVGVGGMGTVFLAEDTQAEGTSRPRTVALKVMRPGLSEGNRGRKRFLREVQTLVTQDHPAIVPVLDVGEDNGVPFFAMPLLRGESLDARLRREKILPIAETIAIAHEIASGLAAAHERGVIHRDVKPANVFLCRTEPKASGAASAPRLFGATEATGGLTPPRSPMSLAGSVKLMDFGLARNVDQTSWQTQAGTVLGTPHYMAPEQIEGRDLDARADLFSLGCVLFRMTTGTLPFTGPSHMSVFVSVTRDTPPNVRHLNPAVPPALAELIERLLEKDRQRRPQSAHEVSLELDTIACGESLATTTHLQQTLIQKANSRYGQRVRYLTVILLLTLAVGVFLQNFKREGPLKIERSQVAVPNLEDDTHQGHVLRQSMPPSDQESALASSDTPNSPQEKENERCLIPQPFEVSDVRRWQLETRLPRGRSRAMAWSPDGRFLALANGYQLRVFAWVNGQFELHQLFSEQSAIRSLAWSPDSRQVAIGYCAGETVSGIRLWNVQESKPAELIPLSPDIHPQVTWSPDGKWLACVAEHQEHALLWSFDAQAWRSKLGPLPGHFTALTWNRQSDVIATGGLDRTIRLWNLDGNELRQLGDHSAPVTALRWSPDGKWLAVAYSSRDGKLPNSCRLWRSSGTAGPHLGELPGMTSSLAWSPDSQGLAIGAEETLVWNDVESSEFQHITPSTGQHAAHVDWNRDGILLATMHEPTSMVYVRNSNDSQTRVGIPANRGVTSIDVRPDGGQLAIGTTDGGVRILDRKQRRLIHRKLLPQISETVPPPFKPLVINETWVRWSPSGKYLATKWVWSDPLLQLLDAETGETRKSLALGVNSLPFTWRKDQDFLFWGSQGIACRDGDWSEPEPLKLPGPARLMSASPSGQLLAFVLEQELNTVYVGQLLDGKVIHKIKTDDHIHSLDWSSDEALLFIACNLTSQLWHVLSENPIWTHSCPPHNGNLHEIGGVPDAAISPDRTRLATTDGIHSLPAGNLLLRFQGLNFELTWFADGEQLASVHDGVVRLRDATTGIATEVIVPVGAADTIVFDTNGRLIQGDVNVFDREFVCVVERTDGAIEVFPPSEFLKVFTKRNSWPTTNPALDADLQKEIDHWNSMSLASSEPVKAIDRPGHDYVPTVLFEDGTYRIWWCGDGDRRIGRSQPRGEIFYSEARNLFGPWDQPKSVLQPRDGTESFDDGLVSDPSVIVRNGLYYMYYSGSDLRGTLPNSRIGVATSRDGLHWERSPSGQPIVSPRTTPPNLDRRYGAGQPTAVVVDQFVYLIFTDTTAPGGNVENGGGAFVIRSRDPLFGGPVEELTAPGQWVTRTSTRELQLQFKIREAFSVDCQFLNRSSPELDRFVFAVHGVPGKSAVLFFDRDFRLQAPEIFLDNVAWTQGPGVVRQNNGHSLPINRDGTLPWIVFYSAGTQGKANMGSWNLACSRFKVQIPASTGVRE